jgi:hypothetical protein
MKPYLLSLFYSSFALDSPLENILDARESNIVFLFSVAIYPQREIVSAFENSVKIILFFTSLRGAVNLEVRI